MKQAQIAMMAFILGMIIAAASAVAYAHSTFVTKDMFKMLCDRFDRIEALITVKCGR